MTGAEVDVNELERLGALAWPALETERLHGWILAFADGVTGRANAVYPAAWNGGDLEAAVTEAEARYRRRGLAPRFKLTDAMRPAELDAVLAARGYGVDTPSLTMAADAAPLAAVDAGVEIARDPSEDWLRVAWGHVPEQVATRAAIATGIAFPRAFALIHVDGLPAASAFCAAVEGWACLEAVHVLPDFRRRGLARRLVAALAGWARNMAAPRLYLQVRAANAPARALYADLGFRELYRYWYRRPANGLRS